MRLFVGGLSYSTNSEGLRSLFAQAGTVIDATVVEDKYSGQSKGFGFVEMSDEDGQTAISRFNGKTVDGRSLTVNEARPREDRGGGGGRSGGGGYGGGGGGGRRW